MADKFMPNAEFAFRDMARNFARPISKDPQRYFLSAEAAAEIAKAAADFEAALRAAGPRNRRTPRDRAELQEARQRAKIVISRYANIIRANPQVGRIDKEMLGIKLRPERLRKAVCPSTAPMLVFRGKFENDGHHPGRHVVYAVDPSRGNSKALPEGVTRIELFVELVGMGEPVPHSPGEMGPPWYLGSFSRNPMIVSFPVAKQPMLVVYYARYVNAQHEVGPWSGPCAAGVEGWPNAALLLKKEEKSRVVVTLRRRALPLWDQNELKQLPAPDEGSSDPPAALPDAA